MSQGISNYKNIWLEGLPKYLEEKVEVERESRS